MRPDRHGDARRPLPHGRGVRERTGAQLAGGYVARDAPLWHRAASRARGDEGHRRRQPRVVSVPGVRSGDALGNQSCLEQDVVGRLALRGTTPSGYRRAASLASTPPRGVPLANVVGRRRLHLWVRYTHSRARAFTASPRRFFFFPARPRPRSSASMHVLEVADARPWKSQAWSTPTSCTGLFGLERKHVRGGLTSCRRSAPAATP